MPDVTPDVFVHGRVVGEHRLLFLLRERRPRLGIGGCDAVRDQDMYCIGSSSWVDVVETHGNGEIDRRVEDVGSRRSRFLHG
jgi:hypothetical protein